MSWPQTHFPSPACGGGGREARGGGSLHSVSVARGDTPTPTLPRKRERERTFFVVAIKSNFIVLLTRRRQHRVRCRGPWPLWRGEPDQAALDVVAAPFAQHHGGFLVLHPFRHRLDVQAVREVDQRMHEGAI